MPTPTLLALALALAPADEQALAARCTRGFAADCRELGRARLAADGVAGDDRLAAAWLTRACEMGDPASCSDLGVLYAIGRGLPQSDERSVALSRRACEQGGALACSNLGTLLAEGVAGPPPRGGPGEDAGAPMLRLFRKACDAGVPEGCTNLGSALDGGKLAARDVRAAARTLRRGCDAGFALACYRLSALVQERADVAPDLTATALATRACRAAVAPACFTVSEKTPPASARTPAAKLVDDLHAPVLGIPGTGGFSPGELAARATPGGPRRPAADLRRAPAPLLAQLPEPIRPRLGFEAAPSPAIVEPDPAIELLLAFRRGQLGQCYEAARAAPAARAEGYAVLFVDGDGRAADVRVASEPADGPLEDCLRAALETWEFPATEGGVAGPFLVRQEFDAAPGPAPSYAGPGFLRPAPRDPACVERSLRVPAELRGSAGSVTVKLAVDAAGKPGLVHALSPVPDALVDAVAAAVRGCPWIAGGDGDGRPTPLWTTLTVKIDAR
jgi:hypothetical protein